MNTNVDLFHDSTKNSSEILTSESNETGSLKIIMPDKLNQLTARSSYICHIDDFVKGNKDYYGFDIQSDSEMEYDYELIINKIKHINNNTGKHEYISIFNNFPVLGFMLCQIANLNDLRILGGYRSEVFRRLLIGVGELSFFSGSVPDHQDSILIINTPLFSWPCQ